MKFVEERFQRPDPASVNDIFARHPGLVMERSRAGYLTARKAVSRKAATEILAEIFPATSLER